MTHRLTDVAEFTERLDYWQQTEHGGSVPVYAPVTPYWRFYCECGAVGGKAPSENRARTGHRLHVLIEGGT